MISGPTGFYQVATLCLEAITDAVQIDLNRICVVPGKIAWDQCECGMLAASLGRLWFTENFPQDAPVQPCVGGVIAGELTFQLMTCAPQPDGRDLAPSCAALDETAQIVMSDAWTMMTTLACTLNGLEDEWKIVNHQIGRLFSAGPDGACVGSEITVTVALNRGN